MIGSSGRSERRCGCCGELFWGSARAAYCSGACRQRSYRARHPYGLGASELSELCERVISGDRNAGQCSARKLLPRLLRAAAKEMRKQGWDPVELLLSKPDDPASDDDTAPGGIEGSSPHRKKWLYAPEEELARIEQKIIQRRLEGSGVGWYERRRDQLARLLEQRRAST
jgi:hypothetical protein